MVSEMKSHIDELLYIFTDIAPGSRELGLLGIKNSAYPTQKGSFPPALKNLQVKFIFCGLVPK